MSELKLLRVLRRGARGKDVRAMKRGLAHAGHGMLAGSFNPLMGPLAVRHLRNFQHQHALGVDGVYGTESHRVLIQYFDRFALKLYKDAKWGEVDPQEPAKDKLQLPKDFGPTHQTAGLPGYPAVDVFADPDTVVLAPEDGVVDRLSGRDPRQGGTSGGPYGWSIYLTAASGRYFMTHFNSRDVRLGQRVERGQRIGTVCDSAVSGKPNTSHIHQGKNRR
jgi:hypothetical protein